VRECSDSASTPLPCESRERWWGGCRHEHSLVLNEHLWALWTSFYGAIDSTVPYPAAMFVVDLLDKSNESRGGDVP
jgi:hypothetical protein